MQKRKVKNCFFLFIFFLTGSFLYSQTQGEKLFQENNPSLASQVLENEIQKKNITDNSYNFLGLSYYQLGEYEKSVDAFERGLKAQPENSKILYYNQGNSYYALKNYTAAVNCYSLALGQDPDFSMALLNKANALLMDDKLKNARESYSEYLKKNPDDNQKERIALILEALDEEILRREEALREQNRLLWEAIDAGIQEENENEIKSEWELVDFDLDKKALALNEDLNEKTGENSSEVDENLNAWEEVLEPKISDSHKKEKVLDKEKAFETDDGLDKKDWEAILDGSVENFSDDTNFSSTSNFAISEDWESLDELLQKEIQDLTIDSKLEYEKIISEREKALEEKDKKSESSSSSMSEDEKEAFRRQILQELQNSQNESRQKLLDDVTNSLKPSGTSSSSQVDSLIDYDIEPELD